MITAPHTMSFCGLVPANSPIEISVLAAGQTTTVTHGAAVAVHRRSESREEDTLPGSAEIVWAATAILARTTPPREDQGILIEVAKMSRAQLFWQGHFLAIGAVGIHGEGSIASPNVGDRRSLETNLIVRDLGIVGTEFTIDMKLRIDRITDVQGALRATT